MEEPNEVDVNAYPCDQVLRGLVVARLVRDNRRRLECPGEFAGTLGWLRFGPVCLGAPQCRWFGDPPVPV